MPHKPTNEELKRADDLIGHNVSGLDSVSLKATTEEMKWRENIIKTLIYIHKDWETDIPLSVLVAIDAAYIAELDDQNRKANSGRLLYQDGFKAGKEEVSQDEEQWKHEYFEAGKREGAKAVIDDLTTNPNPDGRVSPNIQHWIENKQIQLKAKYLNNK